MNRRPRYHNDRNVARHVANRADDLVAALRLGISAADDAGDRSTLDALVRLLAQAKRRALRLDVKAERPEPLA